MSHTLTGVIRHISATEKAGNTDHVKRSIVVETEGEHPDSVVVEAFNDKCKMLDGLAEGETVTIHFNLKAREWQGKWFQNVSLWKVEAQSDF